MERSTTKNGNNRTSVFILKFADDQILFAENNGDLQNAVNTIVKEYEAWGLFTNLSATKYYVSGKRKGSGSRE